MSGFLADAATAAFNMLRGELTQSNRTANVRTEVVHSDGDDDEVEVVEPLETQRKSTNDLQSRFRAPSRRATLSSTSSANRNETSGENGRGVIKCPLTVLCDRFVGETQLHFHSDREELEIRFLEKRHVNAINQYCKPIDDPKRIYLQFQDIRGIRQTSNDDLTITVLVIRRNCSVYTKATVGPDDDPLTPECAFVFEDGYTYMVLQSILEAEFSQFAALREHLNIFDVEKYKSIVDRRFKKVSKFFIPEDESQHTMVTRRSEKRKFTQGGSNMETLSSRRESSYHATTATTTILDAESPVAATRKKIVIDEKSQEDKDKLVLHYPSPQAKNRITLTEGDVDRLAEGEFLNDSLIDFFFKFCSSQLESWQKESMYFFSTHFYSALAQRTPFEDSFDKVKRWTKNVSIFDQKYLFVPINDSCHWSLAVICNPGDLGKPLDETLGMMHEENASPCILFFDSLQCHNKTKILENLHSYLEKEFLARYPDSPYSFDITKAEMVEPDVPRQSNTCDCGVFLLLYALELIKRHPLRIDKEDIAAKFRQSLHETMFDHQHIVEFRDYLRQVIGQLSQWQRRE
ncbi:Aste57867_11228 [Aphanomyces stellatus]|uniref:Aste57867_11228 protein n=1 Tax=Aphanomyces stellatus TaxID=120398 RepID=A0A485KT24_9STRA|nr:hypothetical protein As57867_011186 [Aphanomyces stellatus]VFT88094.1 Aste57867_11228 [Aphanomyces stellatus]